MTSHGAPRPASRMGTACGRRGGLPRSEWETTNVRGQSSKTFQQIALRRCWSSRTSSRTSAGILSRCQSRSRTRADSASLAKAEAKTALIAYAAAPRAAHSASMTMVLVCQCSAAAHGDQSGVTLGWQDRHEFILCGHPVRSPHQVPNGAPPAGPDRPSGGNELDGRAGSCADSQVTSDLHT